MDRRAQRKKEKRARIIEAAAGVFARRGFSATTMSEIASKAAIGKGTIYEYFESKEALFFAVFEWFFQKTAEAARAGISRRGGSALDRLGALLDSVMSTLGQMEDVVALSMECWAASASLPTRERFAEAFRRLYAEFRGMVAALLAEGIASGEIRGRVDPEATAAFLVGGIDGLMLQAWFDDRFDAAGTAKSFMETLIRGLAETPPGGACRAGVDG